MLPLRTPLLARDVRRRCKSDWRLDSTRTTALYRRTPPTLPHAPAGSTAYSCPAPILAFHLRESAGKVRSLRRVSLNRPPSLSSFRSFLLSGEERLHPRAHALDDPAKFLRRLFS